MFLTAVNSSNTLSGVTLDGTLDISSVFAPKMNVTGGLTLDGTILLGGADGSDVGSLTAQGTQAWSGTGSILFGGSDTTALDGLQPGDADPRAGLTVHGQAGEIIGTFVNQGTIAADLAGRPAGGHGDRPPTPPAPAGATRVRCRSPTGPRSRPPVRGQTPAR